MNKYLHLIGEKEGEEREATFFMYRHLDKPFHLDHVFAAPDSIKSLKIKDKEKWIQLSDYIPIVFEIDL